MSVVVQSAGAGGVTAEPVSFQQYVDVETFSAIAKPLLYRDVVRNTLCLTYLDSMITNTSSSDNKGTLALLSCTSCNNSTSVLVAVESPATGGTTCYVSANACSHTIKQCAAVLQQQLRHCAKVTLTAAAAQLLQDAQGAQNTDKWLMDFPLQLMMYDSSSPASKARQLVGTDGPMAAAGCSKADHQQQQQQQLQFEKCTKVDAVLIISWSATFLQEVFELPVRPTDAQVEATVSPRLKRGLYFMLTCATGSGSSADDGCSGSSPVCLVSHTPSSASSTRITMVYTPVEHRGHGYARTAVRQLLETLQHELGYSSICLFADKDKPHIGTMYQGVGFRHYDELHTLKRPLRDVRAAGNEQAAGN